MKMFGFGKKEKEVSRAEQLREENRRNQTKRWIKNNIGWSLAKNELRNALGQDESKSLLNSFKKARDDGASVEELESLWNNFKNENPVIEKRTGENEKIRLEETKKWIVNNIGWYVAKRTLRTILSSSDSVKMLNYFKDARNNGATVEDLENMLEEIKAENPVIAKCLTDQKDGITQQFGRDKEVQAEMGRETLRRTGQLMSEGANLEKKDDSLEKIEKLHELKEKGIITEEEFEIKKKQLLFD